MHRALNASALMQDLLIHDLLNPDLLNLDLLSPGLAQSVSSGIDQSVPTRPMQLSGAKIAAMQTSFRRPASRLPVTQELPTMRPATKT